MSVKEMDPNMKEELRNIKISFGNRVRYLRKVRGMSQESFGLSIGLDRTYINSIEHARRNLSLESMYRICCGLHITLGEMLDGLEFPDDLTARFGSKKKSQDP